MKSFVIALGTNLGDKINNLNIALKHLSNHFTLNAKSRIYSSPAIEYIDQPEFYNQVAEFSLPSMSSQDALNILLKIELTMGRVRNISKGPRTIDLDILFFGDQSINTPHLTIPHPSWKERSFVVYPLQELPCFQSIKKCFIIPCTFNNTAYPIDS